MTLSLSLSLSLFVTPAGVASTYGTPPFRRLIKKPPKVRKLWRKLRDKRFPLSQVERERESFRLVVVPHLASKGVYCILQCRTIHNTGNTWEVCLLLFGARHHITTRAQQQHNKIKKIAMHIPEAVRREGYLAGGRILKISTGSKRKRSTHFQLVGFFFRLWHVLVGGGYSHPKIKWCVTLLFLSSTFFYEWN